MKNLFKNKTILITGGTGSFGKHFAETILKKFSPKKVIIFSRDEQKQYHMKIDTKFSKYKDSIRFFLGDIRDKERLEDAMDNVDILVHAAALKIVDTAEYNPFEFIKTNVIGSQNVISTAIKKNVKKVIALSTDKATSPINLYGATKLCSEKLFVSSNNYKGGKKISFSVVRYGNVMGSRGSVIPHFIKTMDSKKFNITDKNMTRFTLTLDESVKFVINSISKMVGGEIFVPKIPSYKILDLAKSISTTNKIIFTGKRPGEKIHEEMILMSDSAFSYEYNDYYIISSESLINDDLPIEISKDMKRKICKKVPINFCYSSNTNNHFLKVNELKKLIIENVTDGIKIK